MIGSAILWSNLMNDMAKSKTYNLFSWHIIKNILDFDSSLQTMRSSKDKMETSWNSRKLSPNVLYIDDPVTFDDRYFINKWFNITTE